MVIMLTATVRAIWSEAPCDFIQKNAHSVTASSAKPTKTTRQMPKPVRIGRSTARGGRFITSSSCGSNEMTRPGRHGGHHVDPQHLRRSDRHGEAEEDRYHDDQRLGGVGRQHECFV